MKSGKCPKCGSENIYRSQQGTMGYGNIIYLRERFLLIPVFAELTHYVCDDCQYIESYIADDKSMNNIRDEWTPMNPRKSKRKNDEA